jgi:hypothetical protein
MVLTPKTNTGDRLDVEIDYSKRGKLNQPGLWP